MVATMGEVIAWFGWGDGVGAVAAVSAILTAIVLIAPVVIGLVLYGLERLQIALISIVNEDFAYAFVNAGTLPGVICHELGHAFFALITGAEVDEIVVFESSDGQLGHVSYYTRGPWFLEAVQHTLVAVAPTVVGLVTGFLLLRYIFTCEHSVWGYIGLWYLVICVIDHATMSDSDLGHYIQGFWIFILPLYITFFVLGMVA